jgi:hypothetical protein
MIIGTRADGNSVAMIGELAAKFFSGRCRLLADIVAKVFWGC